jgi:hypothetical protein
VDLSVVIAGSRPDFILECLKGFNSQAGAYQFEVIVAGEVDGLGPQPPHVHLIEVNERHPNVKRNRGVAIAQSNLIALLDDDTIPCSDWVQTAIEKSRLYKNCVLAGREEPYSANGFSNLTYRILSSQASEFSTAHLNSNLDSIKWYEVPFCNCIFPKQLWEEAGWFSETIPWHMDDFHFFYPLRNKVVFRNVPELKIRHDRYESSWRELITTKWKLRQETGEKLVDYPGIYWAVTPVAFAMALSFFGALVVITCLLVSPVIVLLLFGLYILLSILIAIRQVGFNPKRFLPGLLILSLVHFVSLSAMHYGALKALSKRIWRRS